MINDHEMFSLVLMKYYNMRICREELYGTYLWMELVTIY
jgi:hypothetical protein